MTKAVRETMVEKNRVRLAAASLAGEQAVSKINGAQRFDTIGVFFKPTLDRNTLAVLLLMPVLRRYELRHERHNFAMSWSHNRCR